jgi:hypothetical protein
VRDAHADETNPQEKEHIDMTTQAFGKTITVTEKGKGPKTPTPFTLFHAAMAAQHGVVECDKRNKRGRFYNVNALALYCGALNNIREFCVRKLKAKTWEEIQMRFDDAAIKCYLFGVAEFTQDTLRSGIERAIAKTQKQCEVGGWKLSTDGGAA